MFVQKSVLTVMVIAILTELHRQAASQEVPAGRRSPVHHVNVCCTEGFGGWPANHGVWSGKMKSWWIQWLFQGQWTAATRSITTSPRNTFGRSLDGGESWTLENPACRER